MKKLLLIVLLLNPTLIILAQQKSKIIGKVTDSISGKPIEYATITLILQEGNKVLNGTTTDNNGNFTLKNIAQSKLEVVVEFIGYKAYTINNITVTQGNETIDLKNILLTKNQNQLQGVTVTTQRSLIENKIDKLVFNAEKDLTSQTGVATDVLKKIPQVSVDVDGNVELAGNSGIRFLINGKPSAAFGGNITDVLQSIAASQIKSIEVITNPRCKI